MDERRQSTRIELEISTRAECLDPEEERLATWLLTRDVSMHGAYLKTSKPFPLQSSVQLLMDLGKHLVEVVGRVVRIDEAGMGVSFTRVEVIAVQP